MRYKKLPLDERIKLASQYALLLVADNKPIKEIIGILKRDYALTPEQTTLAFTAMRSNYKAAYNSTVRNNVIKSLGITGFCLITSLCFYFIGKGMGSPGKLLIIFATLYGLGSLGALLLNGRTLYENLIKPAKSQNRHSATITRQPDDYDKALFGFAFISFFLLCLAAYFYFTNDDIIDRKEITTIENCIISKPARYKSTSRTNRYYLLKLRGHNLECRLSYYYYQQSNSTSFIEALRQGDTVSIQILTSDLDFFEDQYSEGNIHLVNLGIRGRFLVDHDYRNARVSKYNETNFYVLLLVDTGLILLIFLKNLYHTAKIHSMVRTIAKTGTEIPD